MTKRLVKRAEEEPGEGLVYAVDAFSIQYVVEVVPRMFRGGSKFAPVEKDHILIAAEIEAHAAAVQIGCAAKVFESGGGVAIGNDDRILGGQGEAFDEGLLSQCTGCFFHRRCGEVEGAAGAGVAVVVDDEGALVVQ